MSLKKNIIPAVSRILLGGVLFFFLPMLFLWEYARWMAMPASALVLHLVVVSWVWTGFVGVRLLIDLLPLGAVLRRVLASLAIAVILFDFVVLYAGVIIGIRFWGRPASIELISTYAWQLPETLRALGYAPAWAAWVAGLFFLLTAGIAYFFLLRHDWVAAVRRFLSPITIFISAIGLLGISFWTLFPLEYRSWGASAEPLSLVLFPHQGNWRLQNHSIDALQVFELRRQHAAARAAYAPADNTRKSNIVLIVVDALRADHLSLLGYKRKTSPYLESLREHGLVRLATSAEAVCSESMCGFSALASSQTVPNQFDRPFGLHGALQKNSYKVNLIFSGDHKNFYGLAKIYGKIDSYFDGSMQKNKFNNDDRIVLEHLDTFGHWDGKPTMFQFILMSAHPLGTRLEETPDFGPSRNYVSPAGQMLSAADLQQTAINYYDKGVLQADGFIAKILEKLQRLGYMDDTLVVITGDHGEGMGEHGRYSHAHRANSVWEETLRVPFIVLTFGKADPGVLQVPRIVSQVDIAPTLLHALGMKIPEIWSGVPVQALPQRRYIDFQEVQLIGLIDTKFPGSLYKHWVDAQSGKSLTFDLLADPGEKTDITDRIPAALRNEWREHLKTQSGALPEDAEALGFRGGMRHKR
jgi:glucan phosphoethanolaminetransferase (alkaline phosphatase superfamily)